VVRDAVRERRADVVDAEAVDEQLRQLVDRQLGLLLTHRPRARGRRRDDRLVAVEHLGEAAREPDALVVVAAVQVHLPAAGLLLGEHDLVPEPLEHLDRRLRGLGEERVTDAGDEERDLQRVSYALSTEAVPRSRASRSA
jgi:hypothetical protein